MAGPAAGAAGGEPAPGRAGSSKAGLTAEGGWKAGWEGCLRGCSQGLMHASTCFPAVRLVQPCVAWPANPCTRPLLTAGWPTNNPRALSHTDADAVMSMALELLPAGLLPRVCRYDFYGVYAACRVQSGMKPLRVLSHTYMVTLALIAIFSSSCSSFAVKCISSHPFPSLAQVLFPVTDLLSHPHHVIHVSGIAEIGQKLLEDMSVPAAAAIA